jgi:hypothetical protein
LRTWGFYLYLGIEQLKDITIKSSTMSQVLGFTKILEFYKRCSS